MSVWINKSFNWCFGVSVLQDSAHSWNQWIHLSHLSYLFFKSAEYLTLFHLNCICSWQFVNHLINNVLFLFSVMNQTPHYFLVTVFWYIRSSNTLLLHNMASSSYIFYLTLYHQRNGNFELESFQRIDHKAPFNQWIIRLEKIHSGELALCSDFFLHSADLNVNHTIWIMSSSFNMTS